MKEVHGLSFTRLARLSRVRAWSYMSSLKPRSNPPCTEEESQTQEQEIWSSVIPAVKLRNFSRRARQDTLAFALKALTSCPCSGDQFRVKDGTRD